MNKWKPFLSSRKALVSTSHWRADKFHCSRGLRVFGVYEPETSVINFPKFPIICVLLNFTEILLMNHVCFQELTLTIIK